MFTHACTSVCVHSLRDCTIFSLESVDIENNFSLTLHLPWITQIHTHTYISKMCAHVCMRVICAKLHHL